MKTMTAKATFFYVFCALVALPCDGQAQGSLTATSLQAELEEMYESDQAHRVMMDSIIQAHGLKSEEFQSLIKKQEEVDVKNLARLEEIIAEYGWPGISQVGSRGATAAFLVLQHSDIKYQKKYLPQVREAVSKNELGGDKLALLEDRVLVREGKAQIYGTQLKRNQETGALELEPIKDEANVDKRRAEMGMESLADYLKRFDLEYTPPGQ